MDTIWQKLFESLGFFTILIIAATFLIRSIFSQLLSKDLDNHKHKLNLELEQLKMKMNKEVEDYRHNLNVLAAENETRFVKLHEKRATILADLYSNLEKARTDVSLFKLALMRTNKVNINRAKASMESVEKLYNCFQENKLYLSKKLADQMDDLLSVLNGPADFYFSPVEGVTDDELTKMIEQWMDRSEKMHNIMKTIEQEFRVMLGSEKNEIAQ